MQENTLTATQQDCGPFVHFLSKHFINFCTKPYFNPQKDLVLLNLGMTPVEGFQKSHVPDIACAGNRPEAHVLTEVQHLVNEKQLQPRKSSAMCPIRVP